MVRPNLAALKVPLKYSGGSQDGFPETDREAEQPLEDEEMFDPDLKKIFEESPDFEVSGSKLSKERLEQNLKDQGTML